MKKVNVIFAGIMFLLLCIGANAQTKAGIDYFTGKWSVLIKGTPNGDAKMIFILEKKDTLMTGVVQDTAGVEISKISSIELLGNQATIYFNTQGYDINLQMEKVDEDHVKGSLMGMFDSTGDRVKEIMK
jgi:hypothetical protein